MDFTVVAETGLVAATASAAAAAAAAGNVHAGSAGSEVDVEAQVEAALARHSGAAGGKKAHCLACDGPRKGAAVWCETHTRIYGCIYRQVLTTFSEHPT